MALQGCRLPTTSANLDGKCMAGQSYSPNKSNLFPALGVLVLAFSIIFALKPRQNQPLLARISKGGWVSYATNLKFDHCTPLECHDATMDWSLALFLMGYSLIHIPAFFQL